MSQPTISNAVWFKRDLRVADHAALSAAVDHGAVVGLYIVEPELWAAPEASAVQYHFVYESLVELRSAMSRLGGRLLVRVGEATAVL
ncbi:MAG: deoxyribodipyrimidine photo-lyase, partial [Planctomycetota bacterium]